MEKMMLKLKKLSHNNRLSGVKMSANLSGVVFRFKKLILAASVCILLAGLSGGSSLAAPESGSGLLRAGDLDPSFAYSGYYAGMESGSTAGQMAILPDGKMLVAGSVHQPGSPNTDMFLARFNSNGFQDETFGPFDSKVTVDFDSSHDYAIAIVLQQNGYAIVGGSATVAQKPNFALVRFKPDGSLDETFGQNGKVTTYFDNSTFSGIFSLALDTQEKIFACGPANGDLALVNYNQDGSLDTSFGTGGKVLADFNAHTVNSCILTLLPGGKILIAGDSTWGTYGEKFNLDLARYDIYGNLDPTFGASGKSTPAFTDTAYNGPTFGGALVLPGGEILAAINFTQKLEVVRYKTNGSIDPSFGTNGKHDYADNQGIALSSLLQQPDGKILLIGTKTIIGANGTRDIVIMRIQANGSLDSSFGTNGSVVTDIPYLMVWGKSGIVLADKKIVILGNASNGDWEVALARYFGDSKAYLPMVLKQ